MKSLDEVVLMSLNDIYIDDVDILKEVDRLVDFAG